jgi:uncharacterized protein Usg
MWVDNDVPNWFPTLNNIITYPHIKFWWYRPMLNFCSIVVAILKMANSRNCSMSRINSGHHYLPTYQIVISTPFHMWVDYDVPNWFPTLKNFYCSPFSKWPPQYRKIQHCSISKVTFNLFFKPVVNGDR